MGSFSTAISGLDASSVDLSVIANNLANMNTVGYKDSNVNFQDLFYQQVGTSGNGNEQQVGQGVTVGSIAQNFTQGTPTTTGVPTDVAIQGDGFFVLNNNGTQEYSRAGNFSINATGELLSASGAQVMGYPAVNGVINNNQPIVPLNIPAGLTIPPNATTNAQITSTLDAQAATGTTFTAPITVYDSLGGSAVVTITFTKAAAANTWNYAVTVPATTATGVTVNGGAGNTGTLTFNPANGNLTATTPVAIKVSGLTDGAQDLSFNWNLADAGGNSLITQVAGPSATSSTQQDGYGAGALQTYSVGSDGTISGVFSNGQTLALGQIALASFTNPQGLIQNGSNNFLQSLTSGQPTIGVPGTAQFGTTTGGALEESNVDIATEFSNLILAQRDYQANAQTVTTLDQVSQYAISMIQNG